MTILLALVLLFSGVSSAADAVIRRPAPVGATAARQQSAQPLNPRRWLRQPVSFDVQQYPLAKLLREFASLQGVSCLLSEQLDGVVSGVSAFRDPGEFLDMLCRAQHMNWYYDGATVHFFSNGEIESRIFQMTSIREENLRRTMIELGLFDPRFPWRRADGNRILMVQGPRPYLDNIQALLDRQAEVVASVAREKRLGVFRLKHAWAAERDITSGDSVVTVPGVADLLRDIVAGGAGSRFQAKPSQPTPHGAPRFNMGRGVIGRDASAREAAPTPEAPVDDGTPFIQADTRLNAVLVWDYEENLARYKRIVETLDQPLALVEIRAAIVDVEASRTRDLGVSWEVLNQGGRWNNNAGSNVGTGGGRGLDRITGDGFQYSTIFTRGLDQFMARVSALEEDGSANVLSRPSVLTQDNIQATLEHTETFYVKLEGEREVDLADITTGLTLRVTPHVIEDDDGTNAVQLAVYIVEGTDTYGTASLDVENLPRVRQSTISTQAVVHEGEALVVGGTYNEQRRDNESGVPGLRRIPGIGGLFRSRGRDSTKSERLFILSPRIVYPGTSPMLPDTETERSFETSPARKMLDGPPLPSVSDFENSTGRLQRLRRSRSNAR